MQNFEYHTELTKHISRMASTGKAGSLDEWNDFLRELNNALDRHIEVVHYESLAQEENSKIECPSCYGAGTWETECCNGTGGCSCQGGLINMGRCNVCHGNGYVQEGKFNPRANSDFILNRGACFAGSGPSSGFWATKPALGYPKKY